MKKFSYFYPLMVILLALTTAMIVPNNEYMWVDPTIATMTTGPGDVVQREVMRQATEQTDDQESLSYIERLKAVLKRLRECMTNKDCSEEERRQSIELANKLLDLFLLSVGVGIVKTGEFIQHVREQFRSPTPSE